MRFPGFIGIVAGVALMGAVGAGLAEDHAGGNAKGQAPGHAENPVVKRVPIGATTVNLVAPDGFCALTDQEPSDARALKIIGDLLIKTQNELLAMVADCSQLKAWRVGTQATLNDYVQYQTPMRAKNSELPARAEAVKQICAAMRAQGDNILSPETTADLKAKMEDAIAGAKFNELHFLGVLAEDGDACYSGLTQKIRTEAGDEKVQLTIIASTIVKGKVVNYNLYTLYKGADSVLAALTRHRRNNIPALLAANGG